jgi:hypothetical protein
MANESSAIEEEKGTFYFLEYLGTLGMLKNPHKFLLSPYSCVLSLAS